MLFDERWYVEVDTTRARQRLVKRHVLTGVAKDEAEAEWRADSNDIPSESKRGCEGRERANSFNDLQDGLFVVENMLTPTRTILSIDESLVVS